MHVYRTAIFEQRITKHEQLFSKVERLCQEFETMDSDGIHTKFKRLHFYLKRKEGNFRIIAKVIKINREPILCLLKIFARGEPAYKRFLEASKYDSQLFQKIELESDLARWLEDKRNKLSGVTSSSLESLPEDLRFCLERPDWQNDYNDIIVHESETWCHKFSQQEIRSQAIIFRQLIEEIVNDFDSIGRKTNYPQIKIYGDNNYYILFSPLLTKDEIPQQVLLLIAPLAKDPDPVTVEEIIELVKIQEAQFIWWTDPDLLTLENLITYTRRSYPAYILLEEDFWLKIQNGDRVNLALSQEEKELLHTVSTEKSLPLFLNGRAGSGKSTMLFYLFAYYCYRHLELCQAKKQSFLTPPHPLFLTYSKNLSEYARERVYSLLRYHHHFVEETSKLDKIPSLGSFFQSFQAFLLQLLPTSERENFSESKYLSFHLFRQECRRRTPDISPEICWLVIQNYIKGYSLKREAHYLEDETEYSKIPKKEQKVSVAEFVEIRDRVWSWYHQYTRDNKLWDDRDLIRRILTRKYYKSQYTVIFCDEAQDFTRLELQLIMRLSVFSRYNLAQETIPSLPFAFAGDPLQTLNPTGFRWSGFKAAFYEEILSALMLNRTPYLRIELKQLSYNYRSVASIVKVNNLIQLWRKLLCDFSSLEPQQARKYQQDYAPQKFIINHESELNFTTESLLKILKDTIILIPCDEGEEIEFIQNDELLHHFLEEPASQELPWNILSAITGKGLEFKQVILYKFGQRCPPNLWDEQLESTEEIKYFLNKLYVAASRPTEKLFIIDCPRGEEQLWHNLNNQDFLAKKLLQIQAQEQQDRWQNNIKFISPGQSLESINNDDLEANALSFEKVGIQTENIDLLNRAIAVYKKCHNLRQVDYCSAWKLRFARKFILSGDLFYQLDHFLETAECYWQGLAWSKLRQLLLERSSDHQLNSLLHRFYLLLPLIDFMATISEANYSLKIKEITNQIIKLRDFLLEEYQEKIFTEEYTTQAWQTGLSFYQKLTSQISHKSDIFSPEEWLKINYTLWDWFDENNFEIKLLIAKSWYLGQDYEQAIQSWEALGEPARFIPPEDLTYYYLAKAKVTTLPAGLEYLAIAKQYHIIINQWIKTGKNLDASWLKYVAIAFAETNHLKQAFTISCYLDDQSQVQQYWRKLLQISSSFPIKSLHRLLQYYLDHQYWQEAISLAEKYLNTKDFKYYFIYRIALSKLSPEQLDHSECQSYQAFIANNILNDLQWQNYFSPLDLGVVLEKIGSLNYTLAFYEQFTNSSNQKLRNFSRNRWLATKERQVEYFQTANNLTKKQKTQTELTLQAKKWHLTTESVSLTIPEITRSKTKPLLKATSLNSINSSTKNALSPSNTFLKIRGLQKNVFVESIAYGVQQFQLHHLIVRVMVATRQITIIDLLNNNRIYLDCQYGKIQNNTTIVLTSGNQPLSFREFQGKYHGTLWCQPITRLELNLETYSEKIFIEFRNL